MPVRKPITIAAGIALFVAALGVGYLAGRLAADDGEAPPVGAVGTPTPIAPPADPTPADPTPDPVDPHTGLPLRPDTSRPGWFVPYWQLDARLPRFDGQIVGVRIGPDAGAGVNQILDCGDGGHTDDPSVARGTPLRIEPAVQLPGLSGPESVMISRCADGRPVAASAAYSFKGDPARGWLGGSIYLSRFVPSQNPPAVSARLPAPRVQEMLVAGQPAAVAVPILPEHGIGTAAVVTYRDGVVTVIQAEVPLEYLLAFAEAVLQ